MSFVKITNRDPMQRLADNVLLVAAGFARLVIEPNPSLLGQFGAKVERRFRHYGNVQREYVVSKRREKPGVITVQRRGLSGVTKKLPVDVRAQNFAADFAARFTLDIDGQ